MECILSATSVWRAVSLHFHFLHVTPPPPSFPWSHFPYLQHIKANAFYYMHSVQVQCSYVLGHLTTHSLFQSSGWDSDILYCWRCVHVPGEGSERSGDDPQLHLLERDSIPDQGTLNRTYWRYEHTCTCTCTSI